ncbi:hypothetical protein N7G274_008858 [Stereocaulon virgatum]|uniref:SET domain-containing protein n=1 Tax=Stereocaulon virgatum TaxID=373712 RepID=A0ABR3ZXV3_9LECA
MVTTLEDSRFQAKTIEFLQWLQQRTGTTVSPKIQIADLREQHAGRGIIAVEDIEIDEELFSIAHSSMLTTHNSNLQKIKPAILEYLDAWNSLVLVMIYEDGLGEKSTWWPYLEVLPREFNTLIYWSSEELAELQGSAVLDKIGKSGADVSFKKCLLPLVQQNAETFGHHAQAFAGTDAETALLQLAHRMATLIMAYGFDLGTGSSSSEEEVEDEADGSSQFVYALNKGMVPLADLFNADGDLNNAHLLHQEDSVTMIALKNIKKGQQIFNDFGQLPRSDLLRRYGYVTDNYKRWDVVEVDVQTVIEAASEFNTLNEKEKNGRLELAAEWEVLQDGYDLTNPTANQAYGFDRALVFTITALLLDSEDFMEALDDPPAQLPTYLRIPLALVLRKVISLRQSAYRTTIAEDITLLDDADLQGRRRMAIEVRLGEKEILAKAADEIEQRIARMDPATEQDQIASHAKRRKL